MMDKSIWVHQCLSGLTKKAEPPPTRDVNRDSGTRSTVAASANGGWLRRLVRPRSHFTSFNSKSESGAGLNTPFV